MNAQLDITKIKERLAKLLRMAADASSPHEAAIAAERARKLMDQHQLTESDVMNSDYKPEFAARRSGKAYRTVPKWMSILAVAVGKYNDCHARYETVYDKFKSQRVINFLGFKDDTELASQMFERLMEFANTAAMKYMNDNFGGMTDKRIRDTFRWGCSCELVRRLEQMTREREVELLGGSSGKCLVIIKRDLVDAEFGVTKYTNAKRRVHHSARDAYGDGVREGRKANIVNHLE